MEFVVEIMRANVTQIFGQIMRFGYYIYISRTIPIHFRCSCGRAKFCCKEFVVHHTITLYGFSTELYQNIT